MTRGSQRDHGLPLTAGHRRSIACCSWPARSARIDCVINSTWCESPYRA